MLYYLVVEPLALKGGNERTWDGEICLLSFLCFLSFKMLQDHCNNSVRLREPGLSPSLVIFLLEEENLFFWKAKGLVDGPSHDGRT